MDVLGYNPYVKGELISWAILEIEGHDIFLRQIILLAMRLKHVVNEYQIRFDDSGRAHTKREPIFKKISTNFLKQRVDCIVFSNASACCMPDGV